MLIRYFSGRPDAGLVPGREKEDFERACENAGKFAIIGFIDRMDAFESAFAKCFGRKISVTHARKGLVKKPDLTDAQMARTVELSQYDIALYDKLRKEHG